MRLPLLLAALVAAACQKPDRAAGSATDGAAPGNTAARAAGGTSEAGSDSAFLARVDLGRIRGNVDAPVWMLVVSDFQCPYCRMWHHDTYPTLMREYVDAGRVRMAYINLPLGSHQHAQPAAEAAMCAGAQGKFWPVHDGIFVTQERWTPMASGAAVYDSVAAANGVDMVAWRRCISEGQTAALVRADAERVGGIGIGSTPSFMIMRGADVVKTFSGAYPADSFRVALNQALAGAPAARR